nr:reverse transcriptase domain-containing protein [Tanacetum cinerariifolium]
MMGIIHISPSSCTTAFISSTSTDGTSSVSTKISLVRLLSATEANLLSTSAFWFLFWALQPPGGWEFHHAIDGGWNSPGLFQTGVFGMLKACDKDPTKISKIIRRANETLPHFKERWVSESNAIPNVPELMQISSFMSSHKCPELEKRFSDNLPRGELLRKDAPAQWVQRGDRPQRYPYGNNRRRQEHKSAFKAPERSISYVPPQRLNQEVRRPRAVLTLDSLSSTPQEILATEHQLRLPQPTPL